MPRVEFRWSQELWDQVDSARGDVPRSVFVRRALEKALGSNAPNVGSGQAPAPSRASANFGALAEDWKERPLEVPEELADAVSKGLRKFKCGCATTATSPAAKCPQHGRSLA